jgi:hypothetical protein
VAVILLGVVDWISIGKSRPGGRLRPLFQASADKTRWIATQEEFPNSGVVSWWLPPQDAEIYKAWTFAVEHSRTYEPANPNHDLYGVKGSPLLATELIDLTLAVDPEDTRALLIEEGIPLERCSSKRLAFRDRSGAIVGPLELSVRESRLFLDERDALIPLNRANIELVLGEWDSHQFLPPENGLRRVGEVDFSANPVFLKRILRDLREMPSNVIENAKLTERLIGSYSSALDKAVLTPLQAQRLKRLHKLAGQATEGVALREEAIPDLLSLPDVRDAISKATDEAVSSALEQRRATLNDLDEKRANLEHEIATLRVEAGRQRDEIAASRNEQSAILAGFDARVQKKFEDIGKNASTFLAEVAVIRAALSGPLQMVDASGPEEISLYAPQGQPLEATQILGVVQHRFSQAGLGCILPAALLSAWAAGYIPITFGAMEREALSVASDCLFGGAVYFATLGPTLTSPKDLLGLPAVSTYTVKTIGELVRESTNSSDMILLVFENINLCQLDSTVVPLLRSYVGFHGAGTHSESAVSYPSPAGMWPSNFLFAGILVESPLALPLSPELWNYSAFIDTSARRNYSKAAIRASSIKDIFRLPHKAWIEWLGTIEHAGESDTRIIAVHAARKIESNPVFKRMLRRLSSAIDQTASSITERERVRLLAEMTIVPYLISRGIRPGEILEDAPVDVSAEDAFIDMLTKLFQKWGLDMGSESNPGELK